MSNSADILASFRPLRWDTPAFVIGVLAKRSGGAVNRSALSASDWVPFSAGWVAGNLST